MRILNYISVPTPKQGTQSSRRATGIRCVTLVGEHGKILAYADKVATGSRTVGFSRVTFGPAVLASLFEGRVLDATLLAHGRPRLRLLGFRLRTPTGEQRLSGGGWACDAAIGTFRRLVLLERPHRASRR